MRICVVIACVASCTGGSGPGTGNGSSGGDPAGSGSGAGSGSATFRLSGMLRDPLDNVSNRRAVVGIARESDVAGSVDCSKFVIKWDQLVTSLPATYTLSDVPEGTWFLVGLLPDGGAQAPFGVLELTVDNSGIHYNSPNATSSVDIAIQGTTPYACP